VSSFPSIFKASFGAAAVLALAIGAAHADDPTPAAIGYANRLLVVIGYKPSLDEIVPGLMSQLETNVGKTNPEMTAALHATLLDIEPDFVKTEESTLADSAKVVASSMAEQDLKGAVDFFEGPTGKKFLAVQSTLLPQLGNLARAWRDKLSTDILERARVEMKKKGYTF
jgi:hypothetical protein